MMTGDIPPPPNTPEICLIRRWWRIFWNSRFAQFNIFDVLSTAGLVVTIIALYYTIRSVEAANRTVETTNRTFIAEQVESTLDNLREYNYQFINGGFGFYEHLILDCEIIGTIRNVMNNDPVIIMRDRQRRLFLLICKMDSEYIKCDDVFMPYKVDSKCEQVQLTILGKSILREKLVGYLNMRELMLSAINTDAVNKELYTTQLTTFNTARSRIANLLTTMKWNNMYPNISKWCGIDQKDAENE